MHQYFVEDNIPDIVVEEWMHQYFIEDNIPDAVVGENENIIIEVAYTVNNSKFYCYKCQFGTDTAGHLKQHFSTDKCKNHLENIVVFSFFSKKYI